MDAEQIKELEKLTNEVRDSLTEYIALRTTEDRTKIKTIAARKRAMDAEEELRAFRIDLVKGVVV